MRALIHVGNSFNSNGVYRKDNLVVKQQNTEMFSSKF